MPYEKPRTLDPNPGGDTVKSAIVDKLDVNVTQIFDDLNAHESLTATHGASGAIVGLNNTQTLTNKTLVSPVINTSISGTAISTDGNFNNPSNTIVPSQQAVKTYADQKEENAKGYADQTKLAKNQNLSDLQSVPTARTNLGLGTSDSPTFAGINLTGLTASRPVFTDASRNLTSSGTVPIEHGGTGATTDSGARISLGFGGWGNRSAIINGAMDIAQRGTSFTASTSGAYTKTLDRWGFSFVNSGAFTISQSSDIPSAAQFRNSLRVLTTTADSSIGSNEFAGINYLVEGFDFIPFVGQQATLSFWVRGAKTGTHCVSFRNTARDRSYVAQYTINSANTWEYKTITLVFNYSGGTWNFDNGIGLNITWTMAAGSAFHTTAGTWATGNFLATSAQVNEIDSVNNIFAITGVKLELGWVPTIFDWRSRTEELMRCFRYCWITPEYMFGLYAYNDKSIAGPVFFPVPLRKPPTTTECFPRFGGVSYRVRSTPVGSNHDFAGYTILSPSVYGFGALYGSSVNPSFTPGHVYDFQLVVDVELELS